MDNVSEPFLHPKIATSGGKRTVKWLLPQRQAADRFLRSTIVSHLAVFIATTLVWGDVFLLSLHFAPSSRIIYQYETSSSSSGHPQQSPKPVHSHKALANEIDYLTCGTSVAEAKSRGCIYDTLDNAWIPGQCRDDFSIMEYELDGSWFPYADENRTQPLNKDELGDRDFYYTSLWDHIVHCAALWRRQFRAWTEGWTYLDDDPVHTIHCSKYLVDWTDKIQNDYRTTAIKVVVGHEGCHVLG